MQEVGPEIIRIKIGHMAIVMCEKQISQNSGESEEGTT